MSHVPPDGTFVHVPTVAWAGGVVMLHFLGVHDWTDPPNVPSEQVRDAPEMS
jgi:hypothetical protein